MTYTLMFSRRDRYCKALAAIDKNPRYRTIVSGRDYEPNVFRPWSTMFYITFNMEV
jgi:hypothetical protein